MFFQQWTGVNAILYYAPTIFKDLGLTGSGVSLLATGVVGIVSVLITLPDGDHTYYSTQNVPCDDTGRHLGR